MALTECNSTQNSNNNNGYHNNYLNIQIYPIEDLSVVQDNWKNYECQYERNNNRPHFNHTHKTYIPAASEDIYGHKSSYKRTSGEVLEPMKGDMLRQRRRRLWNGID